MSYTERFVPLSNQEVLLLKQFYNGRVLFLDCLAMLHEILISFGTASPYPILARVDDPDEIFRDIKMNLPDNLVPIDEKLSTNLEIALALRRKRLAFQRVSEIEEVTILIDNFIEAILIEYDKVRKLGEEGMGTGLDKKGMGSLLERGRI